MPVPVPSGRPPYFLPFAVPSRLFPAEGGSWKQHLSSRAPAGTRGEEGAKAVASALARLTELKELEVGPVRESRSARGLGGRSARTPEEVEAQELQLHGTAYHCVPLKP